MNYSQCVITSCNINSLNMPPGVTFHSCPEYGRMRIKWYKILKKRCFALNWANSKICSKHFDKKYFDSMNNLKKTAIPTLFPTNKLLTHSSNMSFSQTIDHFLSKMPEPKLVANIKRNLIRIRVPPNIEHFITADLKCLPWAPNEVEMWLLIKQQNRLITRLTEVIAKDRKNIFLQSHLKSRKYYMNQRIEKYKYIIKCLQEKLATIEEQIEILTVVETR